MPYRGTAGIQISQMRNISRKQGQGRHKNREVKDNQRDRTPHIVTIFPLCMMVKSEDRYRHAKPQGQHRHAYQAAFPAVLLCP